MRSGMVTLALALMVNLSGCAGSPNVDSDGWMPLIPERERFFPEEFADEAWINMALFDEPKLDAADALDGYNSRYRLSMNGVACREFVIRIDENTNGRVSGVVKSSDYRCQNRLIMGRSVKRIDYEKGRFFAEKTELAELVAATEAAGIWEFYPEFWVQKDDGSICIDGIQLIMERRNADGYRASLSNAQCTAPPKVRAVARKIIDMSGEKRAEGLLR